MSQQILQLLDGLKDRAKDAVWALSSCMCKESAKVKIDGRTYKIVKVLGEGGFSFVYLAQDETSGRQFALKKIRCPTGAEGVREAMREVEAYRRFRHPNIIRIFDSAVVQDRDGDGKIVYLFLPLYTRGNLQDAINAHSLNGTHFSESEILRFFKGTCEAVRAMHQYVGPVKASANGNAKASKPSPYPPSQRHEEHEDHEENQNFPQPEGDEEGGFSYGPGSSSVGEGSSNAGKRGSGDTQSMPLLPRQGSRQGDEVIFDGDQDLAAPEDPNAHKELTPYAHRDLKPGNIMIADDGITPILMDFGSTVKARIKIETRSQALVQQDLAAEQSSMPYRAPELFDVKTNTTLDEKVDIWSLGCVLYALAYLHSPFETVSTMDQGGSVAMAVLNAQYKYPSSSIYSEGFKKLIDACLNPDPATRPDIDQVLQMTDKAISSLN